MKKQIIIVTIIVVIIAGFFVISSRLNSNIGTPFDIERESLNVTYQDNERDEPSSGVDAENIEDGEVLIGTVFVDVQGEVMNPGVFEVEANVRVGHVIELAGGLTEEANVRGLNQASRVFDEMIIFVPHVDDRVEMPTLTIDSGGISSTTETDSHLISLGTASALELQSLPGIGPALSANIIAHREENGPFATVDELANVAGIGAGIVENIRELVKP